MFSGARQGSIDIAMGLLNRDWIGAQGWARDLGFAAVLGVVLGLIGPFGTFVQAGPALRLAYWIGLALTVSPIYGLAIRAGIGKRTNQHVPGEAGEGINVADHGNSSVGDANGWVGPGNRAGPERLIRAFANFETLILLELGGFVL